jgi:choice-of-anchor A domain-containing protein
MIHALSWIAGRTWLAGKSRAVGLALSIVSMTVASAHAGTLSAANIFSQFDAVIFGNFSSSADVEGRTVIGGDLIGGATFNNNPAGVAASSFSALSVYGNATSGGNFNINNGGGLAIAGTNNVSFNMNGGGSAYVGGSNSGNLSFSGSATVAVGGANSGTLMLNSGGSVYTGANTGTIGAGSSTSVQINGNNGANLNMNGGGTVALNGSNTGTISLNGGSLTYTGSQSGNLNVNGGATATKVASLNLTAPTSTLGSFASTFQTQLTALSTQLNGVAANSTTHASNGALAFNAAPDATGTAVFDVNSSLFSPNSTVTINVAGATSIIINVNVDSCIATNCAFALPNSLNFLNPTGYAATVLWNFVNATSLNFPTEFGGSVLAPLASVTNSSPIDGTLVAASYTGNGEIHSRPYTGTLPNGALQVVVSSGNSVPAPEPASILVVSIGLAGLAAIRRRRPGVKGRSGLCPGPAKGPAAPSIPSI